MLVIQARDLWKVYRYYPSRTDRLKEWACLGLKQYGVPVPALQGVSLEVAAGEAVGVIGKNGAGKSTLLRVLSGISIPTSGFVSVHGRLGTMIELGAQFHPDYTGYQNLEISGVLLGLSRREISNRIRAAVDFAELNDHIDQPIRTYSSGMQARLAFAASTMIKPDVLLVDEVLAVGDQYFVGKCVRYIQEFHKSGRTLVLVSHDLTLLRSLCQRVLWVDRGRLIADGPASDVCQAYLRSVQEETSQKLLAVYRDLWKARSQMKWELAGSEFAPPQVWGQVQIIGVTLCDAGGQCKACFFTGETLVIRIAYRSQIRYKSPNVSVAIERIDGLLMTCHSSKDSGIETGQMEPGEGWFELVFDALLLGPGDYWINVAITLDEALAFGDTNFDRVERARSFSVMAASRPYPVVMEHPVRWSMATVS